MPGTVRAAGCVVLRGEGDGIEVLLIHRPKYKDWSHPKGKCDRGEKYRDAAIRETFEETGLLVELGDQLSTLRYPDAQGRPKKVRYWLARPIGSTEITRAPDHEVDRILWVPPAKALKRLTQYHDRALLVDALEVPTCSS